MAVKEITAQLDSDQATLEAFARMKAMHAIVSTFVLYKNLLSLSSIGVSREYQTQIHKTSVYFQNPEVTIVLPDAANRFRFLRTQQARAEQKLKDRVSFLEAHLD